MTANDSGAQGAPLGLVQVAVSAVQDVRSAAEHRTSPNVEAHLSAAFDNLLAARQLLEQPETDPSEYTPDVHAYLAANEEAERAAAEAS